VARVTAVGQPVNEFERKAIGFFQKHLPDSWLIFHNFEMRQGNESFEIDIAILAPHGVYLIDVKGTHGTIDVIGNKWYPEGRPPFASPVSKINQLAKIFASIIRDSNAGIIELRSHFVFGVVLLAADDAILVDQAEIAKNQVTDFKHCLAYLQNTDILPDNRVENISRFFRQIAGTITGKAKAKNTPLVFGNWQVEEKLGGNDRYTEYRAKNILTGRSGGVSRLMVYRTDPYQEKTARDEEFQKISNAYIAVDNMPSHANILKVKEIITDEESGTVILVTEDIPGQSLRLHITKTSQALTFDQKLEVMRDVLAGLDHAHHYEVIHRNLTPDAILVSRGGGTRLTNFDYARVGKHRSGTIAGLIVEELQKDDRELYQAIECIKEPAKASIASDIYSAGIVFYELLTGEKPFETIDQMMEADCHFPSKATELKPDLPKGIDEWLQKFCAADPEDRYASAAIAKKELDAVIFPEIKNNLNLINEKPENNGIESKEDLTDLPQDYILADRFIVQKNLGSGGFGVVYKVFDSMGDVVRAVKLVIRDRKSVYERLRQEYKTLVNLPLHPHVVKVIWADRLNMPGDIEKIPYIVFDYLDGYDVSKLIEAHALSIEDSFRILKETADGLGHLHQHGVYHQDIKPSNLLWTDNGVSIIDFNMAVSADDDRSGRGGTRRYLPPDFGYAIGSDTQDRIDRDIYALGITLYECVTGGYPWHDPAPPLKQEPKDPRQFAGCADLSNDFVNLMLKMISPQIKDRFHNITELLSAIDGITQLKKPLSASGDFVVPVNKKGDRFIQTHKPNTNLFVTELLTLYSQSQVSNAGTRGLDKIGKETYVPTYLDERLQPALLNGEFNLVIISGNAGDGKTAFIQQFEVQAEKMGAKIQWGANGAVFNLNGRTYKSNYDGSQDEGQERNDAVLDKFFTPFSGNGKDWPKNETRLIAINEGRLVDFFQEHRADYVELARIVEQGLDGASNAKGVMVINLNLRSVVAAEKGNLSILERLINAMCAQDNWKSCETCDIKHKCYALHNAMTFRDSVAGPKVLDRLKLLYHITQLRGRLHITMRDIRSALAFMLVGKVDCDGIHQLYGSGDENIKDRILNNFYFNAVFGGDSETNDRLVSLMKEIDIAQVGNPDIDLQLGFLHPGAKILNRFSFAERSGYDEELIESLFGELPRDYIPKERHGLLVKHRKYMAHLRRRYFFECRDSLDNRPWEKMLPYAHVKPFLATLTKTEHENRDDIFSILEAMNRGEGLLDPKRLGAHLALRIHKVDKGTIRSYRLFNGNCFALMSDGAKTSHSFLEYCPNGLVLCYDSGNGHHAKFRINIDMYEMLMRLNSGYRASIEEQEGFYLSFSVFKNMLSAVPYREILLTENGYRFYRIKKEQDGTLGMMICEAEAEYNVD
jgi:serine/threonine protein kinase